MKKTILIIASLIFTINIILAQEVKTVPEKYGNTLNLSGGFGYGYYSYSGYTMPVASINYEFDIFKNFTLAPFAHLSNYHSQSYWGDPAKPYGDPSYHYYNYNEIIIPLGLKGTYYFDQLFHASSKWDFYAAISTGFIYRNVVWQSGYYGNRTSYQSSGSLYVAAHIGAELHLNKKAGIFLDLSTGVSTFGIAIHF